MSVRRRRPELLQVNLRNTSGEYLSNKIKMQKAKIKIAEQNSKKRKFKILSCHFTFLSLNFELR